MKEAFDERERNIGNPNDPAGLKMADRVALGNLKRKHQQDVNQEDANKRQRNEATLI